MNGLILNSAAVVDIHSSTRPCGPRVGNQISKGADDRQTSNSGIAWLLLKFTWDISTALLFWWKLMPRFGDLSTWFDSDIPQVDADA